MTELSFFREAIIQLTSSHNPEVGIGNLFRFLQQHIPLDAMVLQIFDPGLNTMRILKVRTQCDDVKMDKVVPFCDESHAWSEWPCNGSIRLVQQASKDLFALKLFETLGIDIGEDEKSCIIVKLCKDKSTMGYICIITSGSFRYADMHLRFIKMLINPIAIVTSLYLSLQEQIKISQLIIEKNKCPNSKLEKIAENEIVGADSGLKDIISMVEQLSDVHTPILITGETGVGKELVANLIQKNSSRREGPFVKVNCGAIPDSLIDSELFGHEKGAFTGAVARKIGRFEREKLGTGKQCSHPSPFYAMVNASIHSQIRRSSHASHSQTSCVRNSDRLPCHFPHSPARASLHGLRQGPAAVPDFSFFPHLFH